MYVHSSSIQVKNTPIERSIHIHMGLLCDSNEILIGCFLIRILEGTSIMYGSPMHMHILLYVIMPQLQSVVTAIHEYGIYETQVIYMHTYIWSVNISIFALQNWVELVLENRDNIRYVRFWV